MEVHYGAHVEAPDRVTAELAAPTPQHWEDGLALHYRADPAQHCRSQNHHTGPDSEERVGRCQLSKKMTSTGTCSPLWGCFTSLGFCPASSWALDWPRAPSLSERQSEACAGSVLSAGISDPWERRSSLRSSNLSSVLVLTTSGVPLCEWSVVWPSSPSDTDRFSELKVDTDWHLVMLVGRLGRLEKCVL